MAAVTHEPAGVDHVCAQVTVRFTGVYSSVLGGDTQIVRPTIASMLPQSRCQIIGFQARSSVMVIPCEARMESQVSLSFTFTSISFI